MLSVNVFITLDTTRLSWRGRLLRILGRIDSWRVHCQRWHALKIYLSLNLRIRFERLKLRHLWHVELWTSWLKLLVGLVAVRIRHREVRHRRWCKCLFHLLLSLGWLLWWLLHWEVEVVQVIHWNVELRRCNWISWTRKSHVLSMSKWNSIDLPCCWFWFGGNVVVWYIAGRLEGGWIAELCCSVLMSWSLGDTNIWLAAFAASASIALVIEFVSCSVAFEGCGTTLALEVTVVGATELKVVGVGLLLIKLSTSADDTLGL